MRAHRRMIAVLAAGLLVGPAAQALTVTLDNPNQTIVRPGSGSVEALFSGTVFFDNDELFDSASLSLLTQFPLDGSLDLSEFCPGGADSICKKGGTGLLFSFLVKSTDPLGLYDRRQVAEAPRFIISALNRENVLSSVTNNFSVRVVESVVPEPGTLALLGLGLAGLGFTRRRIAS